jgi:Mg2+ and Co2+ transporter CorA
MASRASRRHAHRRKSFESGNGAITIRVGTRRGQRHFHEVQVTGPRDAGRFAHLIEDQVREFPRDPLIIAVNGYQPWLEAVLNSCLVDYWEDISDLDREVQFAHTMQFPQKASKRGRFVPWTFIIDYMNVPQVYFWSVGTRPPDDEDWELPDISKFRFRVGVWQMGRGACLVDRNVSVSVIFTRQDRLCDRVVSELLFPHIYQSDEVGQPREDEEGVCWLFQQLYDLLTDWQNIIHQIIERLEEAEKNSHDRHLPVKMRARMMHTEVDRIYELKEYISFHTRSFQKLQKLKTSVPQNEQEDPLWDDLDDSVDDLQHFDSAIDNLKERFNNLLDLEFNIQNAVQADNSQFLAIIATLFLPVSFLASLFGMTTVTWPVIWYLYIAVPVIIISAAFTWIYPRSVRAVQKALYADEVRRIYLTQDEFTMLGDELPDSADVPGKSATRGRKKSLRPGGLDNEAKTRARARSRLANEKDEY